MKSACCGGKSEDLIVPALLLENTSKPNRTQIYFPDPQSGTAVSEREEIRVRNSLITQQLYETTAPLRFLPGIPVHVPQSNIPVNSQCATAKTRDKNQGSSTKDTINRLAHGERTTQTTSKIRQTLCKVKSPICPDAVTESAQQNKRSQFSHETKEGNKSVKQIPEVLLHLDQLPCKSKYTGRRNAWKGPSYTDLITAAIMSTQDRKMTVSQIYNWIVQNVSYFKDRDTCESYQGWKNAVRHTLSLRRRFVRLPRTNATSPWYSSWWTISEKHFAHKRPGRKPKPKVKI